eukprot:s902_g24.t1
MDREQGKRNRGCTGLLKSRLLREAALAAVRSFAPSSEHAEMLLGTLREFPGPDAVVQRHGGFPRKEALRAVAHLGSLGHFPSLERIVSSLNSGVVEDRQEAFQLFVQLEGRCDAAAVIGCLEGALFDPKFPEQQQEHPRSQGPIYESLKLTSQRDYTAARQCLLRHLRDGNDVWQQARAATAARYFVRGDDAEMLEALQACMLGSQKLLALACASALLSLSAEWYSEAMPVICAELEKGLSETDTLDALAQVMDHGQEGDEQLIRSLLRFLRKGKRVLRNPNSAKLLRYAWNSLKKVAKPEVCLKGTYEVIFALASKLATKLSGDRPSSVAFARELMAMAKMGGVDDRIFRELAKGFQLQLRESRQLCMKTYQNLASVAEYQAMGVQVLLHEAKDETSLQMSRIGALQVLVDLDVEITEDMVALLLELAESMDVALRAAALRCLRPELKSEISISEFLLKQLEDKDSSIRLAALKSIGKQQDFQGAYLLCLQDDASDVVQLALDLLSQFPSRQEDRPGVRGVIGSGTATCRGQDKVRDARTHHDEGEAEVAPGTSRESREFVLMKAPELLSTGLESMDVANTEDPRALMKTLAAGAINAVEKLSAADKTRIFKHCYGLLAHKQLPREFFLERHRFSGNMPKNFLMRLNSLVDESFTGQASVKAKLSPYETKLPVLLLEMESGGYTGISALLSLYGLPHPDRDVRGSAAKRPRITIDEERQQRNASD